MIWGDYHTHTTYSHGKGSVEDNVKAAIAIGLKEIGISDHGLRHRSHGVKPDKFPLFIEEIAALRVKYPEIKIYAGMEANFLSPSGDIDSAPVADRLDVSICGYHKFVRPLRFGDNFSFFARNLLLKNSKKALVRNTDAYVNAITRNKIDIISHPMHDCKIDLKEVGKAAAEYGTYMELNGKHRDMTSDDLNLLASLGCNFIMDSDAHSPSRVGDVATQIEALKEAGVPFELVHNWERLPVFVSGV